MTCNGAPLPQIPKFYAGRSIFITGASGFMGQVLLERLLTTCPEVEKLFLLLRAKKGSDPEERLQFIKDSPVFDEVRQHRPSQLDKLCALSGDIMQPKLGLDTDDLKLLKNVSVVFHCAATLKFQEELSQAVNQNVRSVMKILDLCDSLPQLKVFVYVSTAYSNAERLVIAERVYEPTVPLHQVLTLVDCMPQPLMAELTDRLIHPKPNTYTFTKALAETAVANYKGHFPVAIFRPTIVVSSLRHPHPGWVQNLAGPCGLVLGAGAGVLHAVRARRAAAADLLPADVAIDTMLAAAWDTAADRPSEARVYNCSTQENPITCDQFLRLVTRSLRTCPYDGAFWYPSAFVVENKVVYKVLVFLLHTVPLYLTDYCMTLLRIKNKHNFIMIHERLQAMNDVQDYFKLREFDFETTNVQRLRKKISPQDAEIFNLDPNSINWNEHILNFVKGVRKYIIKENDEDIPKAKHRMQKLLILHNVMLAILYFLMFRVALHISFVSRACSQVANLSIRLIASIASKLKIITKIINERLI